MSINQAKKRKKRREYNWSWQKGKKYNFFKISVALTVSFFGYQFLANIVNQPITSISIEGSFQQVKSNQIEGAISDHLEKGLSLIHI